MNRIVLCLAIGVLSLSACKEKPNNYNLIFVVGEGILADSLGCYGNPNNVSPQLDSLSKESILFTHCFSNTSQRGPFMGMLRSGQHPLYSGAFTNNMPMVSLKGKRIREVLQHNGYQTAFIGNWETLKLKSESSNRSFYSPHVSLSMQVESSIQYLDTVAITNKPFALYLSLAAAKTQTKDTIPPSNYEVKSQYASSIAEVDAAFGMLMHKVKALGLDKNTIIVFTSTPYSFQNTNKIAEEHININGLRRIPFLLKVPHQKLAGTNSPILFGSLDMMPTILGLLGIKEPQEVHGKNIAKQIIKQEVNSSVSIPWFNFYPYASRGIITKEYSFAFESDSGRVGGVLLVNKRDEKNDVNYFYDEAFSQHRADLKLKAIQWMDYYEDEAYTVNDILEVMPIADWQAQLQTDTAKRPIDELGNLHGNRIMHFHGNNNYEQ